MLNYSIEDGKLFVWRILVIGLRKNRQSINKLG